MSSPHQNPPPTVEKEGEGDRGGGREEAVIDVPNGFKLQQYVSKVRLQRLNET